MQYNPKLPYNLEFLPPNLDYRDEDIVNLIIKARAELGELKGYSFSMPNPLLLLSPAIIKESLASSEIENINTTLLNVLENQLFPESEQKDPDREVLRYRDSVLAGFGDLKKYSLSTRSILDIQRTLIPSSSGLYRRLQNGIENSVTKEILYMPPIAEKIPQYMGDLENYMNNDQSNIDPLIKCAISHYQFEAIHPFSDGNGRTGRIGRILMVLYLVNSKILSLPILYISGYINKNKSQYYRLLLEVTSKKNWKEYLIFMLQGFYSQARETKDLFFEIMSSFREFKSYLKTDHKKIYSADLVEALFSYPIITPVKLSLELGIHYTTASKYLSILASAKVLDEKKVGKYHFFANKKLLQIIHK